MQTAQYYEDIPTYSTDDKSLIVIGRLPALVKKEPSSVDNFSNTQRNIFLSRALKNPNDNRARLSQGISMNSCKAKEVRARSITLKKQ